MQPSSPGQASRPVATIYEAIGLLDDPFPRDPKAGVFVELESQTTAFREIREWLGAAGDGAPGVAVISGEGGSGKSRLLGRLVDSLSGDDRLIGVASGSGSRRSDAQLLREGIVASGGTPAGRTGLELTGELRAMLDEHRHDPLPPVLLIDNAALTGSQLEIMRSILTVATPSPRQTRVQIVLFGPPELPDRIARRRALAELTRKTAVLPPLSGSEVTDLLMTRVGSVRDRTTGPLFTTDALRYIGEISRGNPRAALALAHTAVREAIATGRPVVDGDVAVNAATMVLAQQGAMGRARTSGDDEGAIQTRLTLPDLEDVAAAAPLTRRRGQQR